MNIKRIIRNSYRRFKHRIYSKLNRFSFFRQETLDRIGNDTISITLQAKDHVISFSPHELIGREIYRRGQFHRSLTDRAVAILAAENLLSGRTVLEVGANIGSQSIYLMLSGHFDRIVCIEPDARSLAFLKRNLADNKLDCKATIFDCAAGDRDGEATFHLNDGNHGGSSLIKRPDNRRAITVPVRRIDGMLSEAGIAEEEIGFVWMDIEGGEPEALRSMENLMARRVPILMEFSPRIYGPDRTAALIDHLAASYDRCIRFYKNTETRLAVRDMATLAGDILLLP
jgi:FkbM family methyltransferase